MTPAEAVFEAMTVEYGECEDCHSPRGMSWPADESNGGPHGFYCRDCVQDSVSPAWGMCEDGIIRPLYLKRYKFVWKGTLGHKTT